MMNERRPSPIPACLTMLIAAGRHQPIHPTIRFLEKWIVGLMVWLAASSHAFAQYYERTYEREEHRMIYAGFLLRDFEPRSSNSLPDSLAISMSKIIPTIGFRQGLVDFSIGYNSFTLRGQSKSTLVASATVANEFPITFSRTHALLIPIMISSDYTKVENTGGARENFNIGSIGIGAGVKYRYRSAQFDFSLLAAEAAHWSLEGFSTGSGFSAATMGEALFTFRDVLSLDGIAIGYRVRYQTWNMGDAKFNYNSFSHGAIVGVMF